MPGKIGMGLLVLVVVILVGAAPTDAAPPQRIAEGWYAHNAVLIMLGAQNRIVATVARPSVLPWMFRLVPRLGLAQPLDAGMLNAEELLKLGADLVFIPRSDRSGGALRRQGLNVVEEGFDQFDGLLDCVDSTAVLLQTPLAAKRAQAYRTSFLETFAESRPNPDGPRVLHVESLDPLRVDGDETIIDRWIRFAGGRNAATGLHGNKQPVSLEQVLTWNPDILIIGATAGDMSVLAKNSLWSQLSAVRNGHVFRNPAGLFPWDRYSPELLLQLVWARQIIQTGHVDEREMIRRIHQFYADFYGIFISQTDAARMLAGSLPE